MTNQPAAAAFHPHLTHTVTLHLGNASLSGIETRFNTRIIPRQRGFSADAHPHHPTTREQSGLGGHPLSAGFRLPGSTQSNPSTRCPEYRASWSTRPAAVLPEGQIAGGCVGRSVAAGRSLSVPGGSVRRSRHWATRSGSRVGSEADLRRRRWLGHRNRWRRDVGSDEICGWHCVLRLWARFARWPEPLDEESEEAEPPSEARRNDLRCERARGRLAAEHSAKGGTPRPDPSTVAPRNCPSVGTCAHRPSRGWFWRRRSPRATLRRITRAQL